MKPVFIGGTGRSGTSVLKKVMRQHSRIVTLKRELRIIVDPDGALDLLSALTDRWTPNRSDAAIRRFGNLLDQCGAMSIPGRLLEWLERSEHWPLSRLGYAGLLGDPFGKDFYRQRTASLIDQLVDHYSSGMLISSPPFRLRSQIREAGPYTAEELAAVIESFFDELYRHLAGPSSSATHWLDDTPYNVLHVGELLRLFPTMKFIHIYRDPRDVLASYSTKIWGGDRFDIISRRLAGIYRRWFMIRETLPKECFVEIALESLSEDPLGILIRTCGLLDLPFEEAMLGIPLNKTNSGRWKTDIPAGEMASAIQHLEPAMRQYGYE